MDAWSPPEASFLQAGTAKEAALRALAEALYQRRPVLHLKGHAQPYPAQVLLRTVRKPSVGALSTAAAAACLFKSPSNTVIVIKFDPQFGYAGARHSSSCRLQTDALLHILYIHMYDTLNQILSQVVL